MPKSANLIPKGGLLLFLCLLLAFTPTPAIQQEPNGNVKKISTANLLMPLIFENLDTRIIEYPLRGSNGCYRWKSSQSNVLQLQDETNLDGTCIPATKVRLVSNVPYSNIIWITAEDIETGDILRCESRVAKIQRIEILTKLRTLDVGDEMTLEVLGYDSEGNSFSTLEGVRFEWSISGREHLDLISIRVNLDSTVETSKLRKSIENANFQTDMIVIKGLKTGQATVNVRIKEKDYGEVRTSVVIYVIEHFEVFPRSPLFVLPQSLIPYSLLTVKSRKLIELPSKHYHWINFNEDRGALTQDGKLQCHSNAGTVKFIVNDTQTVNNSVESTVYVVPPASLDIQIKEFTDDCWEDRSPLAQYSRRRSEDKFENVWNLIKDKLYYVRLVVYDERRNPLYIPQNAKFIFDFSDLYMEIVENRGHELVIKAKKLTDKSLFTAKLEEVRSKTPFRPPTDLKATREYSIISKISLIKPHESLHLPLLPNDIKNAYTQQTFRVYALGGSSRYEWVTNNLDIAAIGHEGIIVPKNVGRTVVEVRDRQNPKNSDSIEVEISQIQEIFFLEKLAEVVANSTGQVNIYATGGIANRRYSNCSFVSIDTSISKPDLVTQLRERQAYSDFLDHLANLSSKNVFYRQLLESHNYEGFLNIKHYEHYIKENLITEQYVREIFSQYKNYGLCQRVLVKGNYKGETNVKAILRSDSPVSSQEELRLRVYNRLETLSPVLTYKATNDKEVILSFMSSFTWELEGGPMKWEDRRTLFAEAPKVETLNNAPETLLSIHEIPTIKSKKQFTIECRAPQVKDPKDYLYSVVFSAHNEADKKLPDPVLLKTDIKVSCRNPGSVEIYIWTDEFLDVNTAQNALSETFTIRNNQGHNFQTWAFDAFKRPFYNFSSLYVKWSLMPENAGQLVAIHDERIFERFSDHFQRLILSTGEREVTLRAKIDQYNPVFRLPTTFEPIWDDVLITIKGDIELIPSEKVLYYDENNSFDVEIKHGSGEFSVHVTDENIISYNYDRSTQRIRVKPRGLGKAQIIVEDRKLISSQKAVCNIIVAIGTKIQLTATNTLIQEEDSTLMSVILRDSSNNVFDEDQLRFSKITLNIDSDSEYQRLYALKITQVEGKYNQFVVKGLMRGEYKLTASLTSFRNKMESSKLYSNPIELHVFPKLDARPSKNILIAPGCLTTLEIIGGPSEKSKSLYGLELDFNVPDGRIIDIKRQDASIFLIKGLHEGQVDIVFEVKYMNGESIGKVVVKAKVSLVGSIEILGMFDRKIHVGAQTRLIANLKSGNQTFSPSICPFQYYWTSQQDSIFQIDSAPQASVPCKDLGEGGEDYQLTDYNIAVNATAISAGKADLLLRIKTNYPAPYSSSYDHITRVTVTVIEALTMDLPTYIGGGHSHPGLLLLPPNTDYQLRPKPEEENLRYTLLCRANSSGLTLSESGYLTSSQEKGRSTILVEDMTTDSQIMMVNLLITNIYSIFIENSYRVITLPVDADSHLRIHIQDALGRSFPSPSELNRLSLSVFISNHRVLSGNLVERNSYLHIKAKSEGMSLCTVYLTDNPQVFDVFYVMVGTLVSPTSPIQVHEGGIVQFSVSSVSSSGDKNKWFSEDSDIVQVNPSSGRALAIKEGKTHVQYRDTIFYASRVQVFRVNKITYDYEVKTMTNIHGHAYYKDEYRLSFRVYADDKEIRQLSNEADLINNNLKFTCETPQSEWLWVAVDLMASGDGHIPTCMVKPKKNVPENIGFPKTVSIYAGVVSKEQSVPFKFTQKFEFNVIWMFKIWGERKVMLTKAHKSEIITIHTMDRLALRSTDLSDEFYKITFDELNSLMKINISIPEGQTHRISTNLIVENIATNQSEAISVYIEPESHAHPQPSRKENQKQYPESESTISSQYTFSDYILLAVVVVIVISGIYIMQAPSNGHQVAHSSYNYPQHAKLH